MSVLKVKNGNQWDIVPAIKGDPGDPAADESITDDMLVTDGIKTEIEWLWGNQLTDSREGELLHAEDAYTAPAVDISVDGKSTQVTTTGKNLFDKNTAYAGWYINSSGIRANGSSNSCTDFIAVTGGNSYAFSYGAALSAGNYIAWYTDADESTVTGNRVDARGLQNIVATAPSDANYVRFSFQTNTLKNIQLERGSSATAYEPYTGGKASPNPDYPQEIVSAENPKLAFAAINLLDYNKFYDQTPGSHGSWWDWYAWRLPPGTYTMSCNYGEKASVSPYGFAIANSGEAESVWSCYAGHPVTLTLLEGQNISLARRNRGTGSPTRELHENGTIELQVNIGSTATNYEPYLGNTASLLPDGYSLRSLPDGTKDELHLSYLRPSKREGWAWYSRELTKRVQVTAFKEINWIIGTNKTNPYFRATLGLIKTVSSNDGQTNIYCDAYRKTSGTTLFNNTNIDQLFNVGTWELGSNSKYISVVDKQYETVADFIAAMGDTIVQYPLATPTTTTLDPIELPIMPSRTVNVWSDPATNLKMTYIQDSNLIIENLEATIADIATS